MHRFISASLPGISTDCEFLSSPRYNSSIACVGVTAGNQRCKKRSAGLRLPHASIQKVLFATLAGTIGAAIVGIVLARMGYGVWALVGQQLFNVTVDTIILWLTVKWRPRKMFSLKRLKGLFSFGWKLLVSALMDKIYNDLRQLIIGKFYSSSDLAYYNRGKQLPYLLISNINKSIDSVLFPTMSREQDSREKLRR